MARKKGFQVGANLYSAPRGRLDVTISYTEMADFFHLDWLDPQWVQNHQADLFLLRDLHFPRPVEAHLVYYDHACLMRTIAAVSAFDCVTNVTIGTGLHCIPEIRQAMRAITDASKIFGLSMFPVGIQGDCIATVLPFIEEQALSRVIVMMTSISEPETGFQKSALSALAKLVEVRKTHKARFEILAEGGITEENIETVLPALIDAGADGIIASSYIFRNELEPHQAIWQLRSYAQ